MTGLARRLARALAIAIAIAGVIDPAITVSRTVKPDVSLIAAARLPDDALVDRVRRALDADFQVVRGPWIGASAVVAIGYDVPSEIPADNTRAFVVLPEPRAPFVRITDASAPSRAHVQAAVPIAVRVQTVAAKGRTLVVTARSRGGEIDRVTRPIAGDDEAMTVTLSGVATTAGPAGITVTAALESEKVNAGTPHTAAIDIAIEDGRKNVFVFDRRPSWMSTFVRRALEADPRFVVTSRIGTTTGQSVVAGAAPASIAALPLFEVVIAGAPDTLTDADAGALETFMRAQGGAVVLLLDDAVSSPALVRLTGVRDWTESAVADPQGDPPASAWFLPRDLPPWAATEAPEGTEGAEKNAVWSIPMGAGQLIVSGALDAWRYRDRSNAAFDRFWQMTIAAAADGAAHQAPTRPLAASDAPATGPRDDRPFLASWAAAHGGQVIAESKLTDLAPAMARAIAPGQETRVIHPMRSPLWLIPFALALGAEWISRRRNALR